ncbi:sulfatase-like hydrolase/transferase [Bacteroidota bacterium]
MKAYTLFAIFIISAFISCITSENEEELPEKPNIIYILADDLGYGDLGCYGQNEIRTPNIDNLAAQGMIFTQHYAGSTVCAPSRSSLMTGMHTGHTFIRGNKEVKPEGQWPLHTGAITIASILKKAGYKTGAFGKWGLGFPGSEGDPNYHGFDDFFGYNCQRIAHHYYPYHLWHNQEKIILEANIGMESGDYAHDKIHQKALDFITSNKDQPFFLFLPYLILHAELLVPDDSIFQSYSGKFPEKPYQGVDNGPNFRLGPYGSVEQPHASFASMVTRLDLYVGQVVNTVEKLGLSEKTLLNHI